MRGKFAASFLAVVCINQWLIPASFSRASTEWTTLVPAGYASTKVLHVNYGDTPEKIRVLWADDPRMESEEPRSVEGMRVIGDRFYFLDRVGYTIKQYRSPGTLVWQSEKLKGVTRFTVTPESRVYAYWGSALDQLSCLDDQGRTLWTKDSREIFPRERMKEFGIHALYATFLNIQWNRYGLAVAMCGDDAKGNLKDLTFLVDEKCHIKGTLPGTYVGEDGIIYETRRGPRPLRLKDLVVIGRKLTGEMAKQVRLDWGRERERVQADEVFVRDVVPEPSGGYVAYGASIAPPGKRGIRKGAYWVFAHKLMWRFSADGKLKEVWQFPYAIFAHQHSEITLGTDGNVYHLEFGEKGIDVMMYSRKGP